MKKHILATLAAVLVACAAIILVPSGPLAAEPLSGNAAVLALIGLSAQVGSVPDDWCGAGTEGGCTFNCIDDQMFNLGVNATYATAYAHCAPLCAACDGIE